MSDSGMELVDSIEYMSARALSLRTEGKSIGFVPTMGYLHEGHLSLIRRARGENDIVVVSIFVNPKQFAPNEDFNRYPRDIKRDERLCRESGVDYLFYPSSNDMYPSGFSTYVVVERLTGVLEGKSRPTHFRGVTTVVCKLFNIVRPNRVYFGKKDAQQLIVIERMVKDLNLGIEVVPMPIVREEDGLAMSSRNVYLKPEQRKSAVCLYKALMKAKEMVDAGIVEAKLIVKTMECLIGVYPHTEIDYISINRITDLEELEFVEKGNTLISLAVFVGETRLIDNVWV